MAKVYRDEATQEVTRFPDDMPDAEIDAFIQRTYHDESVLMQFGRSLASGVVGVGRIAQEALTTAQTFTNPMVLAGALTGNLKTALNARGVVGEPDPQRRLIAEGSDAALNVAEQATAPLVEPENPVDAFNRGASEGNLLQGAWEASQAATIGLPKILPGAAVQVGAMFIPGVAQIRAARGTVAAANVALARKGLKELGSEATGKIIATGNKAAISAIATTGGAFSGLGAQSETVARGGSESTALFNGITAAATTVMLERIGLGKILGSKGSGVSKLIAAGLWETATEGGERAQQVALLKTEGFDIDLIEEARSFIAEAPTMFILGSGMSLVGGDFRNIDKEIDKAIKFRRDHGDELSDSLGIPKMTKEVVAQLHSRERFFSFQTGMEQTLVDQGITPDSSMRVGQVQVLSEEQRLALGRTMDQDPDTTALNIYSIERVIESAALELGVDPSDLVAQSLVFEGSEVSKRADEIGEGGPSGQIVGVLEGAEVDGVRQHVRSTDLVAASKYLVRGLVNPNVGTGIHEMAHWYALVVGGDKRSRLGKIFNKPVDEWTLMGEHEQFARDFEVYFLQGEAPERAGSTQVAAMEGLKQRLNTLYKNNQEMMGRVLPPQTKALFDSMTSEITYEYSVNQFKQMVGQLESRKIEGEIAALGEPGEQISPFDIGETFEQQYLESVERAQEQQTAGKKSARRKRTRAAAESRTRKFKRQTEKQLLRAERETEVELEKMLQRKANEKSEELALAQLEIGRVRSVEEAQARREVIQKEAERSGLSPRTVRKIIERTERRAAAKPIRAERDKKKKQESSALRARERKALRLQDSIVVEADKAPSEIEGIIAEGSGALEIDPTLSFKDTMDLYEASKEAKLERDVNGPEDRLLQDNFDNLKRGGPVFEEGVRLGSPLQGMPEEIIDAYSDQYLSNGPTTEEDMEAMVRMLHADKGRRKDIISRAEDSGTLSVVEGGVLRMEINAVSLQMDEYINSRRQVPQKMTAKAEQLARGMANLNRSVGWGLRMASQHYYPGQVVKGLDKLLALKTLGKLNERQLELLDRLFQSKDRMTPDENEAAVKEIADGNVELEDILFSLYANGLLSAIGTPVRNIFGNMFVIAQHGAGLVIRDTSNAVLGLLSEGGFRPTGRALQFGKGIGKALGGKDRVRLGTEIKRAFRGEVDKEVLEKFNAENNSKNFLKSLHGVLGGGKHGDENRLIRNTLESALASPGAFLFGTDMWFKQIARQASYGESQALMGEMSEVDILGVAREELKRGGLRDTDVMKSVQQQVELRGENPLAQKLDNELATRRFNRDEMFELVRELRAERFEAEATFTQEVGDFTKGLGNIRNMEVRFGNRAVHPLRFLLPFINVPTNVVKHGAELTPGLGIVAGALRGRPKAEIAATQVMVSLVAAAMQGMWDEERLTGPPSSDPTQRALDLARGKKPYSIDFLGNGIYLDYRVYSPMSTPLTIITSLINQHEENLKTVAEGDLERMSFKYWANFTGTLLDVYRNASFIDHIAPLVEGPDKFSNQAAFQISAMMPMSSLVRSLNNAYEATLRGGVVSRSRDDLVNYLAPNTAWSKLLGVGFDPGEERVNVFGDPIIRETNAGLEIIGVKYSRLSTDPVMKELNDVGYFPNYPPEAILLHPRDEKPTDIPPEAYNVYLKEAGAATWDEFRRVMGSRKYGGATSEGKAELLSDARSKMLGRATRKLARQMRGAGL